MPKLPPKYVIAALTGVALPVTASVGASAQTDLAELRTDLAGRLDALAPAADPAAQDDRLTAPIQDGRIAQWNNWNNLWNNVNWLNWKNF